jgi:glutathione synthase
MEVVLLVGSPADLDISHTVYANNLLSLGHDVWVGALHAMSVDRGHISCPMGNVIGPVEPYAPFPRSLARREFTKTQLVWLLNQPQPRLAVDIWQLLWRLNCDTPFVNDVTGLMMLNNKNNLPLLVPSGYLPDTWVSNDFEEMWALYQLRPHDRWVVKPPNAGCGADVFVLEPGSTNNRALLQSMTGNASARGAMTRGGLDGLQAQYCILQAYVPHAEEKRIAIIGGQPLAQQTKELAQGEHRGNVSQLARFSLASLDPGERQLGMDVGERLMAHGIRFAGIDVAYPYVFEVNLVNPGGLIEPSQLGMPDSTVRPQVEQILASVPNLGG